MCLVVPMSCGALAEDALGRQSWVYLGFNDYVHDYALLGIFLCHLIYTWLARPFVDGSVFVPAGVACVASVLQVVWIFDCPELTTKWRLLVLLLECLALFCAQLSYAAAVPQLIGHSLASKAQPACRAQGKAGKRI